MDRARKPLRRPKGRWGNDIKIDLREADCEDGRWMELKGLFPLAQSSHKKKVRRKKEKTKMN